MSKNHTFVHPFSEKIFSAGGNFVDTYLPLIYDTPTYLLHPPAALSDHLRPNPRFFALPDSLLIKGPPAKRGGTGSTPAAQHFFAPPFLP